MAIYHLSSQIIGRSGGKSSVASAAYRSGEKIQDERIGQTFDYTKKTGIDYKEILAPNRSPAWVQDRGQLWNQVELIERRKDAQLARELNIALPKELSKEQQIELIRNFAKEQFVDKGMVADLAMHNLAGENPHAHIMLTTREIGPEGFGKKNREWNDRELLKDWRKEWAEQTNRALEKAGVHERIDHRTLKEQGERNRLPQIHIGVHANAMEKRGEHTERGDRNRAILEINADIKEYRKDNAVLIQEKQQYQAEVKAHEKIGHDIIFGRPSKTQTSAPISEPTRPPIVQQPQQKPLEPVGKEVGNGRSTLSVDEWKKEISQAKLATAQPQPQRKTFHEIKADFDQARLELGRQQEAIDKIDSQLRFETYKLEKFDSYEKRIGEVEERLGQLSRYKLWQWNEIKTLEQSKANLNKNKQTDFGETRREHIEQRITELHNEKQSKKKALPDLENRYKEAKGTYDQRSAEIKAMNRQRDLDKSKDLLERFKAGEKLTTQETKLINSFLKELNIKKIPIKSMERGWER